MVKAIIMLEKGVIPPNALFDNLNPEIDADFYNLKVSCLCMVESNTNVTQY
jgi:acyl transferase domain-containing protein